MTYGKIAVNTVNAFRNSQPSIKYPIQSLKKIWNTICLNKKSKKGCPRATFLGLCSEGYVLGIPKNRYTTSVKNKEYGIVAIELLKIYPMLPKSTPDELWEIVRQYLIGFHHPVAKKT